MSVAYSVIDDDDDDDDGDGITLVDCGLHWNITHTRSFPRTLFKNILYAGKNMTTMEALIFGSPVGSRNFLKA
jgi:hypothetical protein